MKLAGARPASLCAIAFFVGSAFAAPASARCYTRWYYPTPQPGCRFVHHPTFRERVRFVAQIHPIIPIVKHVTPPLQPERIEIVIPSLENIDWGKAESTGQLKGIGLLREHYKTD